MQDRKSSKFRFSTCSVWSPVSKQKSCRAPAVAEVCGPPEFNETMRLHLTSLGFTRVICFWLRLAQAVCGSAVNSFSAFSANGSTWKLGCPKLAKPAGLWKIVYQQMHRSGVWKSTALPVWRACRQWQRGGREHSGAEEKEGAHANQCKIC